VALPTSAAVCHAAALLLLTAGPLATQQSVDVSWLPGPQQQTCSSCAQWPDGTDRQMDGQTSNSCTDPSPHAMEIWPIPAEINQSMTVLQQSRDSPGGFTEWNSADV